MKTKVSEASGAVLDYLVAKCEKVSKWKLAPEEFLIERQEFRFRYSTDPAQGLQPE